MPQEQSCVSASLIFSLCTSLNRGLLLPVQYQHACVRGFNEFCSIADSVVSQLSNAKFRLCWFHVGMLEWLHYSLVLIGRRTVATVLHPLTIHCVCVYVYVLLFSEYVVVSRTCCRCA